MKVDIDDGRRAVYDIVRLPIAPIVVLDLM